MILVECSKLENNVETGNTIVTDYGKLLGSLDGADYGHDESLLPYSREQIRTAIRHLLKRMPPDQDDIRHSLIRGEVGVARQLALPLITPSNWTWNAP